MSSTTKRALAASLKKLLNRATLENITIKDIVEDCGVNRQTFYYHFHDIYDLMEWIFLDEAESMLEDKGVYENWHEGIQRVFAYLQDNKALVLNAYHSMNRDYLENYLKRMIRPMFERIVAQQAQGMRVSKADQDFVADLYVFGFAGIILDWVGHSMRESHPDFIEKIFTCLDGSMKSMLARLESANSKPAQGDKSAK